jgi:hypothetical protein
MRTAVFAFAIIIGAAACEASPGHNDGRTDDHAPPVATTNVSVTTRPVVAWPSAANVDDNALLSLSRDGTRPDRELRLLVARSPVPVLAPKDLRLTTPTLVVEGEYFALTGRADGATISLQGTRAAHRYEGVEPITGDRALRGAKGFVTINEGIRTASWIENGAAYSVDVECSDHQDARCQSEDFLLSIVAQLSYVGGSGR